MLLQAQLQHAERAFYVYMAVMEAQCDVAVEDSDALGWFKQLLQHQWDLNEKTEVSLC